MINKICLSKYCLFKYYYLIIQKIYINTYIMKIKIYINTNNKYKIFDFSVLNFQIFYSESSAMQVLQNFNFSSQNKNMKNKKIAFKNLFFIY